MHAPLPDHSYDRRLLYPAVLVSMLVMAAFATAMSAQTTDPSLLLHYTFDQVQDNTTTDSSAYGHDGQVTGASEHHAELGGRQGILRLNGKTSRINLPNAEALHTGGDLTFEMWVRGNGPGHDGGKYLKWGSNFVFYGTAFPFVQYSNTEGSNRTQLAPHSFLDNDWAHVALVMEYPRVRLYRDGELASDTYLPFPAIKPDGAPRYIAENTPIDLDEVRVYSRALTPAEIKAHAQDREIDIPRDNELRVYTHWYEDTITLHLAVKGSDVAGPAVDMALLNGDGSNAAEPQHVALAESFKGSGRYVATAVFPLAGLEGALLDAVAHIHEANGDIQTVYHHVKLDKPAWVDNAEGTLTEVPTPWSPLEAQANTDGSVRIDVWGRSHVFGSNLFPQQIDTLNKPLLTAPVTLHARADGKYIQWQDPEVALADATEVAATIQQQATGDAVGIDMNTVIEFDGYAIFDCTITAKRDTTLEQLVLDIPLRSEHATLCFGSDVYPEQTTPRVPMSVLHMGAVEGDLAFRFSPNIWLGDEELGLTWQAESNEHWRYGDPQKAIEILPRGDTTHFRANWIIVPTQLKAGQTLHYKFALQATPVKPMLRDSWDLRLVRSDPYTGAVGNLDLNLPDRYVDTDHELKDRIYSETVADLYRFEPGPNRMPALDWYRDMGMRHLYIGTQDNWPWPLPSEPDYARGLHRLIDTVHAKGMKIYDYMIHERMPTNLEEFDVHGAHMTNTPFKLYNTVTAFCPKSMAAQDANVYALAQRLDLYGDDGVYLDGTGVHHKSCQNTAHGCGYYPGDGAINVQGSAVFDQAARGSDTSLPIHPTYPVFADRKFIQRLYVAVKDRRPDGVLDVHSWYLNSGGLAYADILWTGEQWWHLSGKGTEFPIDELPLDMFRTMFLGYQIGTPVEVLSYRLLGQDVPNRKIAAISLLHDVPVRVRVQDTEWFHIMSKLWKLRDEFGAKQAEKLFYWNNQGYVTVENDGCYSTLLKHPTNGTLAIISNLRHDTADVHVRFNLESLGLQSGSVTATNVLTDETTPLDADGLFTADLGSHEWVYLWLKATH